MLKFFRTQGHSMEPWAHEGDFVVVRTLFPWEKLRRGEVVVAPDPRETKRLLVKRIKDCNDEELILEGDNTRCSTDSKIFGPIPQATIMGKIIFKA